MVYDKNNIFSKILRGEAQAEKVYENEYVLCFKDIYPKSKIHILIIPPIYTQWYKNKCPMNPVFTKYNIEIKIQIIVDRIMITIGKIM